MVAKIQKAASARSALEAALAEEPVQLAALDAALETARGARGLLDDGLLAAADSAQQRLQAETDARQAQALAARLASVARLTQRDPLVAQPAQSAERSFVANGSGPARMPAYPAGSLQPPPQQPGDSTRTFSWGHRSDVAAQMARPPGRVAAISQQQQQQQSVSPPPAPQVPLSMAAFLPAEVPPQAPPRESAFAAPLQQPSPSPALGWGAGSTAPGPALSNGHGYGAGGAGPFGGGLFGLGGGAFAARQQPLAAADAPPVGSSAAPALYTPFGGVGSAFGAVTLPQRMPEHGLLPPPAPLQTTAFGALPGAELQSLWQSDGGAERGSG